ncbi:hypothetical protein EBZ39_05580 [bacterium]|nr:hypothetical protein [bacterium]
MLTLQYANGSSGYRIWKEKNGSRILNASGLISKGWQQTLTRVGTAFSGTSLTNTTHISSIAGRVCPTNVFLNYDNMTATSRCVYYDTNATSQSLSQDWVTGAVEGVDYIANALSASGGAGTVRSFYEGNIKTCADKGMRLPTMYETTMDPPASNIPTGDGITPTWAGGTNGIPSNGWSWTSSNTMYSEYYFWLWNGVSSANMGYNANFGYTVRCILPNSDLAPGAPTGVSGSAGNTQVTVTWTAPTDIGGSSITDYVIQYSSNSGTSWTTFSDTISTATTATVNGLTTGTAYVFRVAAVNSGGTGLYSAKSSSVTPTPPPDPSGFTATVNHSSQITLSWINNGSGSLTFQVAYQTGLTAPANCSSGTVIAYTTISSNTSYAVTGLTTQDYAFRVCARDSSGGLSAGVTTTGTTGWKMEAYLKAPNPDSSDYFGSALSLSGETIVVGAYSEDNGVTTITNGAFTSADASTSTDSGAAYVFKRSGTNWTNEAYLKAPNNSAGDIFGYSTSISGDTIVVGANNEDNGVTTISSGTFSAADASTSTNSGAAYVFKRSGSTWTNEAYLKATNNSPADYIGYTTSISGDTIVVGTYLEDNSVTTITNGTFTSADTATSTDSGAAYVFKRSGTTWTNEAYLKAPNNNPADYFANSVSISGDTIVVGANSEDNGATTISNGTFTAADASTSTDSGAVYVFRRIGSTWANEAYLKAPNNSTTDRFGSAVSISNNTILVGAYAEDNSVTTITNGTFTSADAATSTDSGAAYVFKRSGTTWTNEAYLKSPNNSPGDSFGISVSISGDTLVVGSFNEDNGVTTILNGTFTSADAITSTDSGAAYVFKRSGTAWAHEAYLKASNNTTTDRFGAAVSISGDTIVVGAFNEDNGVTTITNGSFTAADASIKADSGAVYVFRRAATTGLTPVITSVTPSTFSTIGGGTVSIFGSGFQSGATVTVGGVACTNVIWQSYNEILCTLPAGSSGSATVVVNNSGGASGSSSSSFSYVAPNDPTGFTATAANSTTINLSWASGGGTTATYQAAYQTGSTAPANCSSGTVIGYATIGASTSIAVTSLSLATQDYAFRVCARDSSGGFSSGTTTTGSTGWYQEAYLKAPNADVYDSFGGDGAISISGNTVVVGAAYEDSNQTTITNGTTASADNSKSGSGAAYVFKRTGTAWAQEAYLKAPNADASDYFSYSFSISGDTIIVGAPFEDSSQTTITNGTTASTDNNKADSGAAYVFKRTGTAWTQEAYLKAPNADASDNFGNNPISISGDTIVIGVIGEDSNQTTITAGTTASADNSKVNSGAAYVFKRMGTTWAQEAYLKAPNADASDLFGSSISISADTVVVGASKESSNQTTITNGTTASADNSKSNSGAAYVFKRTGSTWAQEAYLKAPNADASDSFGNTSSISGDTIVVGAFGDSSNQTAITNGTTASADNSAAFSGAAYVFKRTGTTWAQEAYLKAPNGDSSDIFGFPVSISGDTIVVGAYGEDSNQTTITNGATASSDNSKSSSGAVYVFKRLGSLWVQEAYLKAPNADASDYFGYSVAISGDTITVGAKGEDSNQATITNDTTASSDNTNTDSGAVYVFRRTFTSATPTVTSVTPTSGAAAGNNIIIFGTNFRLGATATVGTAACTSVTIQGPNEIICTLGTKPSTGALTITVTNPNATSGSLSSAYTYP